MYKRGPSNITANVVIAYNKWSQDGSCISTIYTLTISNVQPSDEGWYCCVATNDYGSMEECTWLEVNSKLHNYVTSGLVYSQGAGGQVYIYVGKRNTSVSKFLLKYYFYYNLIL